MRDPEFTWIDAFVLVLGWLFIVTAGALTWALAIHLFNWFYALLTP